MAYWALVVPAERYAAERLYRYDTLDVPAAGRGAVSPGDGVLLVAAGEPPMVYAAGRVTNAEGGLLIAYTRRSVDAPHPAVGLDPGGGDLVPLREADFGDLAARLAPAADRRSWLVSLDLPIEAESPAEAVRQFWAYVAELGPRELPAFVAPVADELAMQAYVLGARTDLDPEDDEAD